MRSTRLGHVLVIAAIASGLLSFCIGLLIPMSGASATDLVVECGQAAEQPQCVDAVVRKVAKEQGVATSAAMLFAFHEVTPDSGAYCHDTALWLGEAGWLEFRDTDVALANGTPICGAAYLHGVQEGVGADKKLTTEAKVGLLVGLCQNVTEFYSVGCAHGIGHAVSRLTGNVFEAGIDVCQRFEPQYRLGCAEGVTMKYFEGAAQRRVYAVDPKVVVRAGGSTPEPYALCAAIADGDSRVACFTYATRAYEHDSFPSALLVSFCNGYQGSDTRACFKGLGRELGYTYPDAPVDSIKRACFAAVDEEAAIGCGAYLTFIVVTNQNDPRLFDSVCAEIKNVRLGEAVCEMVTASRVVIESENSATFGSIN